MLAKRLIIHFENGASEVFTVSSAEIIPSLLSVIRRYAGRRVERFGYTDILREGGE